MIIAQRYHDISCGHRVVGHESVCAGLHGHNYRITFFCRANSLDKVGRVIDFSVIKAKLCMWLEDQWDHKFLMWTEDPWRKWIATTSAPPDFAKSICLVEFNPTAENIAQYLLNYVGPVRLAGTGVTLYKVTVEETRKCAATAEL